MTTKSPNRLFVAYKPANIGSNSFLGRIKRKYGVKKAGFSGTLDPFAKGVLIIAFGKYTQLFRFLKKTPKTYRATLWLGAMSETLDIEKIHNVSQLSTFDKKVIEDILSSLVGELTYLPPKYSAKKIDGKRAYDLARDGKEVALKHITSTIYDINLLSYMHPFITFDITVSEGAYIRSIGAIIAERLGVEGSLSSLERLCEGEFRFDTEKALDPLLYLNMSENVYLGDTEDIKLGKKLKKESFTISSTGIYVVKCDTIFSIIEIRDDDVKYLLNGVSTC